MRMADDPKFALFVADDDQTSDARGSLNLLNKKCQEAKGINGCELLGEYAAFIPLPDGMPVLASLVDCAERGQLQYRVRVFGRPILDYPSKPN